ncbi:hypothetical protein ACLKMH_01225 [Psychromonas sp. KJ10-10]|uniref:hypothetical protein n=1 Tax=Psychromonas sp. KJ10-10 TaxID=3391823 RepID=UPI0039B69517
MLLLSVLMPSLVLQGVLLLCLLVQLFAVFKIKSRLASVNKMAMQHYDNKLMEKPYTGHCDDLSKIELAMIMKRAELRAVTARAGETSDMIIVAANEEFVNSQQIDLQLHDQDVAIDAMDASAEQMLSSINEVVQQAKHSSEFRC